jgi:LmbE family N-acetylglucosaminyl deacetylase
MATIDTKALRILTFFAHPDDETVFLGGTLAFLAERGAEIHYLCATRGEGGEMGDPPICFRDELGEVREKELRCAVDALGGSSVQFLDYIDPTVGPDGELYPFSDDFGQLTDAVKNFILNIDPHVILTHGPGGEYGHPAHIQAHQSLLAAMEGLESSVEAIYAPSWLSRETGKFIPEPDFLVDITHWREQKINAVQCHRSQHGLFLRHGSARVGRSVTIPEIVRTREALCRLLPEKNKADGDALSLLLQEISMPNEEIS